jgi:hypothetical protein
MTVLIRKWQKGRLSKAFLLVKSYNALKSKKKLK